MLQPAQTLATNLIHTLIYYGKIAILDLPPPM